MPATMELGNYQAERTDAGLLIRSVPISKETTREQRPDFERDLDVNTFHQMLKHFDRRVAKGKVGAFVLLDHDGPGVGQISAMWVDDQTKELVADLLITNPEVIAMVERKELTERSIEWGWNDVDAKLKGVALLAGKFGQDSEGWPDLTVTYSKEVIESEFVEEGLQDFSRFMVKTVQFDRTLTDESTKTIKRVKPMLTPEDLKALGDLIDSKIDAKLSVKADTDPVNEDKVNAALQRIQKREREITITGLVENLARKGYSNKEHLRKSFEKFGDNIAAMEVEFKRLMEKADEDVQLEMETTYEKPSLEAELEAQYQDFVEAYPHLKVSKSEFKMVCKGENKNPHVRYEKAIEVL